MPVSRPLIPKFEVSHSISYSLFTQKIVVQAKSRTKLSSFPLQLAMGRYG